MVGLYNLQVMKWPKGANAWIDAVQFERGRLTDNPPRRTGLRNTSTANPLAGFSNPDRSNLSGNIKSSGATGTDHFAARSTITQGKAVWEKSFTVLLNGHENKKEPFRIPLTDFGCYRLVTESDGQVVDEIVFSVLPLPRNDVSADNSYFGRTCPDEQRLSTGIGEANGISMAPDA